MTAPPRQCSIKQILLVKYERTTNALKVFAFYSLNKDCNPHFQLYRGEEEYTQSLWIQLLKSGMLPLFFTNFYFIVVEIERCFLIKSNLINLEYVYPNHFTMVILFLLY
jgi:hypothetical protein